MNRYIVVIYLLTALAWAKSNDDKKDEKLPPCQACRSLVNSFMKGVSDTARNKFEGGNTDWEETRLGSYANSEVRLVEIQEKLCNDVSKGKTQCHTLAEDHESDIERWWFNEQQSSPELFDWLCINNLKVCCPNNTFGPECKPCPGGIDLPCGGRGTCKDSGTRLTSPKECQCNKGYGGESCDRCAVGYHLLDENGPLECIACHKACQGHCREAGPKGCEVCKDGWFHNPEFGCVDIDECLTHAHSCDEQQFCVNIEGSFQCMDCHESCDRCTGDGPDNCVKCSQDFVQKDGMCIGTQEASRLRIGRYTRYGTYLGLTAATYIIFRKKVGVAAVIGMAVAAYIGVAEYSAFYGQGEFEAISLRPIGS